MHVAIRRRDDGTWEACARRRDGSVACVRVREADIAREVARRVAHRLPAGADASGLWSGIKHLAKKVAKARVLQKLADEVKRVAKNPLVSKAVGLGVFAATGVPPQVTEAALHFAATGKLDVGTLAAGFAIPGGLTAIANVSQLAGSPTAPRALAGAVAAAQRGNPRATAVVASAAQLAKRVRVLRAAGRLLEDRARAGDPVAAQMLAYAAGQVETHARARGAGATSGEAAARWRQWIPTRGHADWTTPGGRHGAVTFALGERRSRVSIVQRAPHFA